MKFLILGCNGMAGHLIAIYLKEQGHDVLGYSRTPSKFIKSIIGDVHDTKLLKKIILEGNFDSVINCVGLLNQFAEMDPAEATFVNAYIPHFLAKITADTNTQVIHMSTDCVFSGKRGAYLEDDYRDGDSFYDRSKALGELKDPKNLTLRNSIVGPDLKPKGIGLLNWFMQQSDGVQGYTKSIWTGQTTLQLAKTMEVAAKNKVSGLYNAVPNCSISKYELLKLFNHYLRDDKLMIYPIDGIVLDKSLKRSCFDFDFEIPDYETMIFELSIWMKSHHKLYPHYHIL